MPYKIFKTCIGHVYVTNGKSTIEIVLNELAKEDSAEIRRKIYLSESERSKSYEDLNNEETNRMLYILEKIQYALTVDMNDVLFSRRYQLYNYYNLSVFDSADRLQTLQLINEVLYDARNIERVHFEPIAIDEKNIEEIKSMLRSGPISVMSKLPSTLKNHIEIKKEFVSQALWMYSDNVLTSGEYVIIDKELLKWLLREKKRYYLPFSIFKDYKSLLKEALTTNKIIEIKRR